MRLLTGSEIKTDRLESLTNALGKYVFDAIDQWALDHKATLAETLFATTLLIEGLQQTHQAAFRDAIRMMADEVESETAQDNHS